MTVIELYRDLYRHMEWADAAVWSAVLAAEAASADEGLRERLHHLHLVQRVFLSIWRGEAIDGHAGEGLDARDLREWASSYYPEARAYLASAGDSELAATVTLPWTEAAAERLGFEPAPTTLLETLVQVYAHTAHHRGQICTRLRELGGEPPLIDFVAWVWHGRPDAEWR